MKYAMSPRAITFAIQGAVLLAMGAAVVYTARSAEIAATAAATLVQNVDEPARNFYQQNVNGGGCDSCTLQFMAVPAGKTLRLTHASCSMQLADSGGVDAVAVYSGTPVLKYQFIPSVLQGDLTIVIANSETDLYTPQGDKPVVSIGTHTGEIINVSCTLSGYYVTNSA